LKNSSFIIVNLSAIAFALNTALLSWWLPWRAELDEVRLSEVLKRDFLDFQTPIPWLAVVVIVWGFSLIKSEQFNKALGDYAALADNYDLQERDLMEESEAHWDTKHSYYASLASSLKYILTSPKTGFSDNSRVTVYRTHAANQKMFRNIFRYAGQHRFSENGRDAIPVSQGLIGLAYATTGLRSFRTEFEFDSDDYWDALRECLSEAPLSLPPKTVRMRSKHLVAKAITDHITGKQVGVIAYESINADELDEDGITKHLADEDQNISRFISHLAKLDSDLNPFPFDTYGEEL